MHKPTTIQGTPPLPKRENSPEIPPPKISIAAIGPASYRRMLRNRDKRYGDLQVFQLSLYDINQALEKSKNPENLDEEGRIRLLVPKEFHDFLPIFREAVANQLPPHRRIHDHSIPLKPDFEPPFGPIYSLSRFELEALKEWLERNLKKGFIRASSSPAGAPILFMKKPDGSLRLCVDYRGLNEGTMKEPLPIATDPGNSDAVIQS